MVVAGMDALSYPAKHFDTSGKSAAQFHHRAICKTPSPLVKTSKARATGAFTRTDLRTGAMTTGAFIQQLL
jgi:hypothetical protein